MQKKFCEHWMCIKILILFVFLFVSLSLLFLFTRILNQHAFEIGNLKEFGNNQIKVSKKSVLIIEQNDYHMECLPGWSKYFVDLGFDVDVVMCTKHRNPFCLFEKTKKKIRIFEFEDLDQFDKMSDKICEYYKKYNYLFLRLIMILTDSMFYLKSLKTTQVVKRLYRYFMVEKTLHQVNIILFWKIER
ncbi:MAG: hypothetical protein LBF33_01080 [Oscillospiraceae bacterium]|jgi:hypothetical protein|nr:hypothetical protein [Oscillospiraceae bacterium]